VLGRSDSHTFSAYAPADKTNPTTTVKEKPVMRKVRRVLPIILAALAILGVLAVAGHAGKPSSPPGLSKPEPTKVQLTGGLVGIGAPTAIRVTFVDDSFGYEEENRTFMSNPDYPPSLTITGPGGNTKTLRYYYCTAGHEGDPDMCNALSLDPPEDGTVHNDYYYCLQILGGNATKKSTNGEVVFPVGSAWRISSKATMSVVAQGTLGEEVTYTVVEWSS